MAYSINELKKMKISEMEELAKELRRDIINTVKVNGG